MSINIMKFETDSGIWEVVGTESTGKGLNNCIDEIKNIKTGERITRTRLQLFNLQEQGKIKPLNIKII